MYFIFARVFDSSAAGRASPAEGTRMPKPLVTSLRLNHPSYILTDIPDVRPERYSVHN